MAGIPEPTVARVVADVSKRMADPRFAEVAVGEFVEAHPDASRFLSLGAKELGGSEAVVHAVFHAHVLARTFEAVLGRPLPRITFMLLDRTAGPARLEALTPLEPALADYLRANVESEPVAAAVAHLALAMRMAAGFSRSGVK